MTGAELIAAERKRQIEEEGWTIQHDVEEHSGKQLAATASYIMFDYADPTGSCIDEDAEDWDWMQELAIKMRKRGDVGRLVVAGALVAAEIDRLLRVRKQWPPQTAGGSDV